MNRKWFSRITIGIIILVFISVLIKLTTGNSDSAAQNKWGNTHLANFQGGMAAWTGPVMN